ncbi:MAG: hypothetical protein JO323_23925 [Acidobacteriia bacterium]|nr:hypothetical protein [Terriglobia bacterium]
MNEEHIGQDILERYVRNALFEDRLAHVEEHLIECNWCQERLREEDAFLRVFRHAAAQVELRPESIWQNLFAPRHRFSLAMATMAGSMAIWFSASTYHSANLPAATVALTSYRGVQQQAHVSPGKRVALTIEARELPPAKDYAVQIVTSGGHTVFAGAVGLDVTQSRLNVPVLKLGRGLYWVRVYTESVNSEPVMEYSLRAE